ncbi:hypothetical protein [Actinomadura litoris]|uniref:Uncharacterized protein n=1 Tax=Actinomadura litoris TaxID=2678616 RepID=A0A7K1LAN5_9ACTN|nr:hypothetical protein [Actinomadura litoris]MUN41497.1 hypothetical protein [Actinomadura litoris]
MRIPSDWRAERASGWFELHTLSHIPCGWNTGRCFDLLGDASEVQVIFFRHNCAGGNPDTFVVQYVEPGVWTVGRHDGGQWIPDSDHGTEDEADARAAELNGGAR